MEIGTGEHEVVDMEIGTGEHGVVDMEIGTGEHEVVDMDVSASAVIHDHYYCAVPIEKRADSLEKEVKRLQYQLDLCKHELEEKNALLEKCKLSWQTMQNDESKLLNFLHWLDKAWI